MALQITFLAYSPKHRTEESHVQHFQEKEKQQTPDEMKAALRMTMLGCMGPYEWPRDNVEGFPWSLFIE